MTLNKIATRTTTACAFAMLAAPFAHANSKLDVDYSYPLAFGKAVRSSDHTLLVASAIILIIGLAGDDHTLAVVGGVGVLVSLFESGQLGYQSRWSQRDLLKSGSFSFGVRSYHQCGVSSPQTSPYIQWTRHF